MNEKLHTTDFQAVFENTPGCNLLLAPDLTIIGVSLEYLKATLTTRERLLDTALFEAFPDNPDDPTADGVRNLRASLDTVLRERRPHRMAIQKYDIRRPDTEGGGFEVRYWSPINSPVLGASGEVACIIHHVEDVTQMVTLQEKASAHDQALHELAIRGEERLSLVLDAAPDAMIVVDSEAKIRFANAQTGKLFGYSQAELLGQPLETLVPDRFRSSHVGHLQHFLLHPTRRSMGSGLELFGRRKDGSEVPVEISLSPLPMNDGLCVTAAIRDISERKRLEAATKLVSARLSSAVESIQDAFALFDESDRLVLCNSVYRNLLAHVAPGQIVGKSFADILDLWVNELDFVSDEARTDFLTERLARRNEPRVDFTIRTRDGRTLRVIDRRTPEGGIVKTIWDLSDEARQAAELHAARAAAEEASAAKSDFLSSMSHELRTPLNSILGFSQLLQRDKKEPLAPRHRDWVAQISRGGEHLLRLIDDILDLSRVEARGISISTEPVDVLQVLQEVHTTLAPAASAAGIAIELEAAPDGLPMLSVDRTRFAQILMNFGSNAVKYNRPGGTITFAIEAPRADSVRVTVFDTGMGIPLDKQHTVFQPFQRAGQENGTIEGTGIGLAISKRLAELMGGGVGFRSTYGKGSEFWVEVPTHAALAQSSRPPSFQDESRTGEKFATRALVLYVEDNPANVTFMEHLLESFDNVELLVARTAEEGLVIARARRPTLIIMDINLPGMSGLDALRELRVQPETAKIPVIALSAAASPRDRERGEHAGFYRYLTKPLKVAEFEATLNAVLC